MAVGTFTRAGTPGTKQLAPLAPRLLLVLMTPSCALRNPLILSLVWFSPYLYLKLRSCLNHLYPSTANSFPLTLELKYVSITNQEANVLFSIVNVKWELCQFYKKNICKAKLYESVSLFSSTCMNFDI